MKYEFPSSATVFHDTFHSLATKFLPKTALMRLDIFSLAYLFKDETNEQALKRRRIKMSNDLTDCVLNNLTKDCLKKTFRKEVVRTPRRQ